MYLFIGICVCIYVYIDIQSKTDSGCKNLAGKQLKPSAISCISEERVVPFKTANSKLDIKQSLEIEKATN